MFSTNVNGESMRPQRKIFLTGGTGFFGKSILSMVSRGFLPDTQFVILSRNPSRFLAEYPEFSRLNNVRYVAGDVRNFAFPEGHFDEVIHAATPAVTTLPPGEMRSIILDGMTRVIEFTRKCGAEKMLFTSSGAVYGHQPPTCTNMGEDFPCAPVTEYGIAKLEAENRCLQSGIHPLIARCFSFVGPYLNLDIHFAIGNFIRNALNGGPIVIQGDGTPYRSYLYADDLVEWLFAILERGEFDRPYHVGSPDGISIKDLAGKVASHFAPEPEIKILGTPQTGAPISRYVPDVSRAMRELHLKKTVSLDQAIQKTIQFQSR